MNPSHLHQLQHRQKRHDYLQAIRFPLQHIAEFKMTVFPRIRKHRLYLLLQADRFPADRAEPASHRVKLIGIPLYDRVKHFLQLCQRQTIQKLVQIQRFFIFRHFPWNRRFLKKKKLCLLLPLFQLLRHIFIHLIFQQPAHQFGARIFLIFFLFFFHLRKKHPRFDVQKRRRHHQKITDHIQILMIHLINIFQILLRNQDDRNIVDTHFIFFNQMKQQVQRSFKII